MTEVTLMVTDETARHLERLILTGRVNAVGGKSYEAYCLALMSRPIKGDRWLKLPRFCGWARLPKRLSYGG